MTRRLGTLVLTVALVAACDADAPAGPDASTDAGPGRPLDAGPERPLDAGEPSSDAGPPLDPGLFAMTDLTYAGAFRVSSAEHGESSSNYAVGTLGFHATHRSLYLAGHAQQNAIAEFAIPDTLGMGDVVDELPIVDTPLQGFRNVLGATPNGNPDGMDRVTGLYVQDGHLVVQANRWYDASGRARDTTLLVVDGDLQGTVIGYFELDGAARSAGFIAPIPAEWRERLGGPALAGWASNYSIVGRYSVGPSLFAFDPSDLTARATEPAAEGPIAARAWMEFPHAGGAFLADDALARQCDLVDGVTSCDGVASSLWNHLSRAMYGFVVPGTRTYAVFGSTGGLETGIGYKIDQDNGNRCGGYCAYGADDYTNYYWLFDLDELIAAASPSEPRPYDYGAWELPFDDGGSHRIAGGAWDPDERVLYLSLGGAGQVGTYDRPPLIVAYRL